MTKALVNRIIPFSSVDGLGNRTAIFLQGCNFDCLFCHNPETIKACDSCGVCISQCPFEALSIEGGKVAWDKTRCRSCDACLQACTRNSSPKAVWVEVDDILEDIKRTQPFISGITVSGGECMLQAEVLIKLMQEVKKLGLTTFIDTNGSIPFWDKERLTDLMDMAMVDLKSYQAEEHMRLTGENNHNVIKNIKYLAKMEKLYEVRTVVVPGILDNYSNVNSIAALIAALNPNIRYKLIKYRPMGVRKHKLQCGAPSDQMMEELSEIAYAKGCENVIIT